MSRRPQLLLLSLLLGCCTGSALETVTLRAVSGQTLTVEVEIADTAEERAQGLMNRASLPEGRGMLFLFPVDTQTSFWMKNTLVSLDLIFISAEGIVVDLIESAQPLSETLLTPDSEYRSVLEVPAGTVSRYGLQVGDSVTFSQGVGGGVSGGAASSDFFASAWTY